MTPPRRKVSSRSTGHEPHDLRPAAVRTATGRSTHQCCHYSLPETPSVRRPWIDVAQAISFRLPDDGEHDEGVCLVVRVTRWAANRRTPNSWATSSTRPCISRLAPEYDSLLEVELPDTALRLKPCVETFPIPASGALQHEVRVPVPLCCFAACRGHCLCQCHHRPHSPGDGHFRFGHCRPGHYHSGTLGNPSSPGRPDASQDTPICKPRPCLVDVGAGRGTGVLVTRQVGDVTHTYSGRPGTSSGRKCRRTARSRIRRSSRNSASNGRLIGKSEDRGQGHCLQRPRRR